MPSYQQFINFIFNCFYLIYFKQNRKERLMLPKEDIHTEYKEAQNGNVPRAIWETISAFANTDGGTIMLGVHENQKLREFTVLGVNDADKMVTDILNTQKNGKLSEPVIIESNISIDKIEDKDVINIFIPKINFKRRPVYLDKDYHKAYVREKDSDRKVTDDELRMFLRESDSDIDSDLLDNVNVEDFSILDIRNYQAALSKSTNDPSIAEQPILSFLQSIGLANVDRSTPDRTIKFNKAAILLFGTYEAITYYFPNFFLDFIIQNDPTNPDYDSRIYTSDENDKPGNIYSFFTATWQRLSAQVSTKFDLDNNLIRRDDGDQLLRALREALVNALIHADYASKSQVKITMHRDSVIFSNPGEMRVSTEDFIIGGNSVARNPKIFNAFVRAKLGEHTGSGGPRIFATSQQLQLRRPDIEVTPASTKITIWTLPQIESILAEMPEEWHSTYLRITKLLSASYKDLKDLYKNPYQGHKILDAMVESGVIHRKGEKKATIYLLPSDDPQMTRMMTDFMESIRKTVLLHK